MFQSYYDVDHEVLITSKSGEATVNCYCQEIDLSSPEFKEFLKDLKNEHNIIYKIKKWLRKKVEK